jgi:hypothetical protein
LNGEGARSAAVGVSHELTPKGERLLQLRVHLLRRDAGIGGIDAHAVSRRRQVLQPPGIARVFEDLTATAAGPTAGSMQLGA